MVKRRKFLSKLYDNLYQIADQIIKHYNPCEVSKEGCLDGKFCCKQCRHLGKNGCKVRALACKLWLCQSAIRKYPQVYEQLTIIKDLACQYNLCKYRASKKETLDTLDLKGFWDTDHKYR